MDEKPRFRVTFLYTFCNSVKDMHGFYTGLLEIPPQAFNEEYGWLAYQSEDFTFQFWQWDKPLPVTEEYAWQPGDPEEGTLAVPSWSLLFPEERYREIVEKIQASEKVRCRTPEPNWRQESYWGWTVLDPQGNTVEVYTTPKEKPGSTVWTRSD